MKNLFKINYLLTLCAMSWAAHAQQYPNKPIRIIVAYTPAGATDILARAVGQKMSETFGQPVVIENRPGANGNIGTDVAAKATPDGHTLLMVTAGTHGINPSLYRKLPWDAVKDFAPVSLVAMVPNVFPMVLLFGLIGWTGTALDIGSVMTASIALGTYWTASGSSGLATCMPSGS